MMFGLEVDRVKTGNSFSIHNLTSNIQKSKIFFLTPGEQQALSTHLPLANMNIFN